MATSFDDWIQLNSCLSANMGFNVIALSTDLVCRRIGGRNDIECVRGDAAHYALRD